MSRLFTRRQVVVGGVLGGLGLAVAGAERASRIFERPVFAQEGGRPRTPAELTARYTPELDPSQVEWIEVGDDRGLKSWHGRALTEGGRMNVYAGGTALEVLQGWGPDHIDNSCADRQRQGRTIIVPGGFNTVLPVANVLIREVAARDSLVDQLAEAIWQARIMVGDTFETDQNRPEIVVGVFNPANRQVDHWLNTAAEVVPQREVLANRYPQTVGEVHRRVTPFADPDAVEWVEQGEDMGQPVWHGTAREGATVDVYTGNDGLLALQVWQGWYEDRSCGFRQGRTVIAPGINGGVIARADNWLVRPVPVVSDQNREAITKARVILGDTLANDLNRRTIVVGHLNPFTTRIDDWINPNSVSLPEAVVPTPSATATSTATESPPLTITATLTSSDTQTLTPVPPTATGTPDEGGYPSYPRPPATPTAEATRPGPGGSEFQIHIPLLLGNS